jgi:quinoprotein glucose dehydrogenase
LWRPAAPRDRAAGGALAAEAAGPLIPEILKSAPEKVRVAAIIAIAELNVQPQALAQIVMNQEQPVAVRTAALGAMEALRRPELPDLLKVAFDQGKGTSLRREAIGIMMRSPNAAEVVGGLFKGGDVGDRKAVLEALATAPRGVGDSILGAVMDTLLEGSLPKELQLDLLEAATNSKSKEVAEKLAAFEKSRDAKDPLAAYSETLYGGDAAKGKKIFLEKGSVACIRCHKVGGEQVVVGPDLKGVSDRKDRRYFLESILKPNAQIAPGFESVLLKLKGNMTVGGVLRKETSDAIVIADPNEGEQEIEKSEIVERAKGMSPMPEGLEKMLTKRELRDLIEFLASLKGDVTVEPPSGHGG